MTDDSPDDSPDDALADPAVDAAIDPLDRPSTEPLDEVEAVAEEAWRNLIGPDGYLPVLLLIFFATISGPMFGDSQFGAMFNIVVISGALLLTIFRSTKNARMRRITIAFLCTTSILAILALGASHGQVVDDRWILLAFNVVYLAVLLVAFPLVLIRSLQHRRVTINTICANLSAYLLIGLIFLAVYRVIGQAAGPFFAQTENPTAGQYSYFSFITLTTVGFGDLTPRTDVGRGFVMIEAILGQVFLVTTMARVVSLLGEERHLKRGA